MKERRARNERSSARAEGERSEGERSEGERSEGERSEEREERRHISHRMKHFLEGSVFHKVETHTSLREVFFNKVETLP